MQFKKQIASVCILFLQFSGIAYGNPGFLPTTDKTIPESVVSASGRVYKITSQGGRLDRVILMSDAAQVKSAQNHFAGDDKWWQKTQLDSCTNNRLQVCPIFDQMGDGSAFTLNTPDSMYTNLHNFYEVISANYSLDKNATSEIILKRNLHVPLLFALTDQNGKSVVDTSKTTIGTLEFFNSSPHLLGGDISNMNNVLGRASDVVRVHLPNTTALPLSISKTSVKQGDTVYLLGYPMATSNRSSVGAVDSDGNSLRISVGNVISFADWKLRTGNNFGAQEESILQENMIFFDADCEHGNSGGPLVNENGEVVGIFMALYRDTQKGTPYRVCGALNTLDESKLADLWSRLPY